MEVESIQSSDQLSLFSMASESVDRMIAAVRAFEFDEAEREIANAAQIDPYLTNLDAWRKIVHFMRRTSHNHDRHDSLAEMWRAIPAEVESGRFLPKEAELAENEIIEIARLHFSEALGFLDGNQTVHWGALLSAVGNHREAQKVLLDTISDGHTGRADLWAAYADALWAMGRHDESQVALMRALILAPLLIDFHRMHIPEVRSLFARLLLKYRSNESASLLLFFGWLEGLWKISGQKNRTGLAEQEIKKLLHQVRGDDRVHQFRRFSLNFYLDRLEGLNVEAREAMMALAPDLFRSYLKKIEEIQKELF
jgi:tetratricopeptide (TPR) repeat protein